MSSIIQRYEGPLAVDYETLRGTVKGVVTGGMRGIRREKEGIAKVLGEFTSCTPALAEALGIGSDLVARVAMQTATLTEVRAARVILDKLSEVFEDTEACLEDEREGAIGLVVDSVRRASRQQPTALVSFEATVRYHGQLGVRAFKTRMKRKKQAAAGDETAAPPAKAPEVDPKATPVDPTAHPTS